MPQLSVIVPVYNVEDYLRKCVESILNQTFTDFELLLVDDGSTDGSGELCEEFALLDKRVKVFHKENEGQSVARNFGISHACGNYLSFIDSDDWIEKEMYDEMLSPLSKNREVDIVVCGHRVVTETGNEEETVVFSKPVLLSGAEATMLILKDDEMPSFPWNKIYRKNLFEDIRFPEKRLYEDTATIYKTFHLAREVYVVNRICYNYLRRQGSTCLEKEPKKEARRAYDNFRAFYERYLFAKEHEEYSPVLEICASKAFLMGIGLIHYMIKEKALFDGFDKDFVHRSVGKMEDVLDNKEISSAKKAEYSLLRANTRLYRLFVKLYYQLRRN